MFFMSYDELGVLLDMKAKRIDPEQARDELIKLDPERWGPMRDVPVSELYGEGDGNA